MPSMDKGFSKTVEGAMSTAGAAGGESLQSSLLGSLSGVAGKIVAALGLFEIAKKFTELTSMAVDAYADYEQLIGGVETLYGDAADELIANAERAYKTAGMSANDYMELTTSFAAAMVNSLGGDTEEAARMADMAIRDMSDNANKMGTDMAAIQNAYQGFAKQNYTMLDNLKLGYGGTKTEMERLLADAEAISGIHYDIENYADVVEAIHVIQTEMGITGTTAEEAASTISGSWGMLQASWDNLLVSLAGGGQDIDAAVKEVFDSLMTWLGNVGPRVLETVGGIIQAIPSVIAEAWPVVRDTFMGFIEDTFGSDAADKVRDVFNTFHGIFERLGEKVGEFTSAITEKLLPAFQGLIEGAQPLIDAVFPVIADVVETVGGVFIDVGTIIVDFIAKAVEVITGFLPVVTDIFNGVKNAIEGPINKAKDIVKSAIDKIKGFFSFEFKWPHIPLPHFSISGSINPLDWLTGGLPKIGIEWYAKGGIVDGATLIGAGEKGSELIWPSYEPYLSKFSDALVESMDGGKVVNNYYIDGNLVAADARLSAALDVVAESVNGRRRMGTVRR